MLQQRRVLFGTLALLTTVGVALECRAIWLFYSHVQSIHLIPFVELILIGLVIAPLSVKLPSGASWRPGIPLMMMSIFLVPPTFVVLVPLPALILITARARGSWWKYLETISHVSLGLAAGACAYQAVLNAPGDLYVVRELAVITGLSVHLIVNRTISAMIVALRERRSYFEQAKRTIRELHWGYLNSYLLILLASMMITRYEPFVMVLISIVAVGVFMAVSHYSHAEILQRSAWMDGLTNVENRAAWQKYCDMHKGEPEGLMLAVVDIDNFKDINDRHGHLVGDEILRQVAAVLTTAAPRHSRIFRVGGDEFVVAINSAENVNLSAEIRQCMFQLGQDLFGPVQHVNLSVGQASFPADGLTVLELFRTADGRMYKEKRSAAYIESGMEFGVPASILGLLLALESKDTYTSGHNLRVSYYAWQLAQKMDLNPELVKAIFRSGLVHDVGKIGIPDAILNKPGKLSSEEIRVVQQHPVTGYEMCSQLEFTPDELDAIHYHHERFDGTGYPGKLSGLEIPLIARILAVVDVYDALTSARAYRGAWSHQEAMRYLIENRSTQFDSHCVNHWVELNERLLLSEQFHEWVKDTTFANKVREVNVV